MSRLPFRNPDFKELILVGRLKHFIANLIYEATDGGVKIASMRFNELGINGKPAVSNRYGRCLLRLPYRAASL